MEDELGTLYRQVDLLDIDPPSVDRGRLVASIPKVAQCLQGPFQDKALRLLTQMARQADTELQNGALSVLDKNVGLLQELLEVKSESNWAALPGVAALIDFGDPKQKTKAKAIMHKGLATLSEHLDGSKVTAAVLDHMLQYGRPEIKERATAKLSDLIQSTGSLVRKMKDDYINGERIADNPLYLLLQSKKSETFLAVWKAVGEHLQQFGLAGFETMGMWRRACKVEEHEKVILMNLAVINDLERARKGSVKELNTRQNIVNFGRYPLGLLLDQFPKKNDQRRRRGSISVAQEDWNGAFYDHHTYLIYENFLAMLGPNYIMEVVEISPARVTFSQQMNPSGKVETDDFAFVEVHGKKNVFDYGEDEDDKHILVTAADIRDHPLHMGLNRVKKGGIILLGSCETGFVPQPGDTMTGIGQDLSEISQSTTVAPEEPAGILEVEIVLDEQGLLKGIKPSYVTGGFEGTPVKARTFVNGVLCL